MQKTSHHSAFTLIELLVVVVIIGILAGVLIPRLVGARERASDAGRVVKVTQVTTAVDMYAQDNGGVYPVAPLSTGGYSTVEMVADKIAPFVTTIPTDPGKGVAAVLNLEKSCIVTGDSFGYTTDPAGTMFAITALMESKKGNTTNCLGIVDSNKGGGYEVVGKGLTYNIISAGGQAGSSSGIYLPEWTWTPASCFGFSAGTITSYTPNGTTCKNNEVVIPATIGGIPVTTIGANALRTGQLTSVNIPNSVTTIGASAFRSNLLTSVNIPNSVTTIGASAFYMNELASIDIPSSVTSIGDWAFAKNKLTSITIPNSVTSIGAQVFRTNLLTSVTIPNSVTSIGDAAFYENQLSSLIIPNSVTTIGKWAFQRNELTSVTIPNSVTNIGDAAFYMNQLTSIEIPNSVTSIGNRAFQKNQLTSVTIPSTVTALGSRAFGENQLTSITFPSFWNQNRENVINGNQLPDDKAFMYARYPDGTENKSKLISYGGANKNVVIPDHVTTLVTYGFASCGLTSVSIPSSITAILTAEFKDNYLTTITIPASVATLGTDALLNNGPNKNSANITDFVPNTLQTRNLVGTTWVKQ